MVENGIILALEIVAVLFFLIAPFAVNFFYQRKAARRADDLLAENAVEFNRQIRANAVIVLVRRSLWGLFLLFVIFRNTGGVWGAGYWFTTMVILSGMACFAFGLRGYKTELGRLKSLE